jgi:hypothetical protein
MKTGDPWRSVFIGGLFSGQIIASAAPPDKANKAVNDLLGIPGQRLA